MKKTQAQTGTSDISFDPAGPFRGKWYIRRADGVLNSYETLDELAAFADNAQLLWQRYDALWKLGRAFKDAEWKEMLALKGWLNKQGILIAGDF
jgi:hypothetical protein